MNYLIRCAERRLELLNKQNKAADAYELDKAINTIKHCIEIEYEESIVFATNVLETILQDGT